jgi:hypothetical protein
MDTSDYTNLWTPPLIRTLSAALSRPFSLCLPNILFWCTSAVSVHLDKLTTLFIVYYMAISDCRYFNVLIIRNHTEGAKCGSL